MNRCVYLVSLLMLFSCNNTDPEGAAKVKEECYYQLSMDTAYYRSIGKGIGPFSKIGNLLYDQFADGKRSIPPLAENGELVFADECTLLH